MKHTTLKENGQITIALGDEKHPLIIHHKEGLTIGFDGEEMVALAHILADLLEKVEDIPDPNNFDAYDDARQLAQEYEAMKGKPDSIRKAIIEDKLKKLGYAFKWNFSETRYDLVPINPD